MEQFVIHDPIIRHVVEFLVLAAIPASLYLLAMIKGEE